MISIINSIPTSIFVVLCLGCSTVCFAAAMKYKKKGDKTSFILFLIVGFFFIPTIIFRVVYQQGNNLTLQKTTAIFLLLYLLVVLATAYYRGWKKYREKSVSSEELQRIKIGLILLPATVLIAILCFVFWN